MSEAAIPNGTTLLLKRCRALMPGKDWHDHERAHIAIAADKIAVVASNYLHSDETYVYVIDARDHLVVLVFVYALYHSHDVLAKGTLEDVPL